MHTSLFNPIRVTMAGLLAFVLTSCMKGPGFMKQGPKEEAKPASSTEEAKKVVLDTIDAGLGAVTGNLTASSDATQVLQAHGDSEIAGSLAEFPPGAIAIDTAITIGPGASIATSSNLQDLLGDSGLNGAAPAVTITSSVALDTTAGFTMQIPVPSGAGLHLDDPLANLVVIYKVKKVAENSEFSGLLTKSQLAVVDGYVRFTTSFFGTFQAIITKTLVQESKEVVVKPAPKVKKTYFARGFRTTTFGEDEPRSEGFAALFHPFSPATVKADADSKLSTGLLIKRSQEVTP